MSQLNLFDSPKNPYEPVLLENGEYIYVPDFYTGKEASQYLSLLTETIQWRQESMNMFGKRVDFPRLSAWYGDEGKSYSFSGLTLQPESWTEALLRIKSRVEAVCQTPFNSVLLNRYRNGNDSMAWHADNEKELGLNPVIASVNFGATRRFHLKHIETKQRIDIDLQHGSLLVMQGELQHFWQHQVPKSKRVMEERINLTFRLIK